MRLAEDQIRRALLHKHEEIRYTAVSWYSEGFSTDESIMPIVLDSVERYGTGKSWRMMREAQWLVQTEATVDGLIAFLARPYLRTAIEDNFRFAAALALCRAPVGHLVRRTSDIARLPSFPEVLRPAIEDQILLVSANRKEALAALVQLAEKTFRCRRWNRIDILRADGIVEALAAYGKELGPAVLALLQRRKNRRLVEW